MKIIVVSQGAVFSTFDIYYHYLDGFRDCVGEENVQGFPMHTLLTYHGKAAEAMSKDGFVRMSSSFDAVSSRAARELLLDIITFEPDALFFISGDMMPKQLYQWVHKIRRELNRNFVIAGYMTEAPYVNEVIDKYSNYFDVLFTNDKYDKERRNPNDDRFVFHLPHSYSPVAHYPKDVDEGYKKDLFFVGTMFPERIQMLSSINLEGIDTKLFLPKADRFYDMLEEEQKTWLQLSTESGIVTDTSLPNLRVADYYRGSKISLNMHRISGWTKDGKDAVIDPHKAYSYNPRINEIIACGGFPLTDFRQEIADEYGDSVAIYEGAEDLENKIRYYLEHDDVRENMKYEAQQKLVGKSYTERAENVLEILQEALNIMETKDG